MSETEQEQLLPSTEEEVEQPVIFEVCPHCQEEIVHRHGYVQTNHRLRFRCLNCGKTFTSSYGTLYYRSRLDKKTFKTLKKAFGEGSGVTASALLAHVDRGTALHYERLFLKEAKRYKAFSKTFRKKKDKKRK